MTGTSGPATGGQDAELRDEAVRWPVLSTERLYDGEWVVKLRRDVLHVPGHPEDTFARLVLEDPGAVIIVAIDDADRVAVLRQYRHPVGRRSLQFPAGKLDLPGEDPLLAAQRELREEAGLAAARWRHLTTTFASAGISEETHALYLAEGLTEVDRDFTPHHEEAEMSLEWVPFSALLDAVLEQRVQDAPLVSAVLFIEALRHRASG